MLLHKNAEPFFLDGEKEVAFLLIHGFTGSPSEMLLMGRYLNDRGYPVLAPLLAGHGTSIYNLEKTGRRDWLSSALDGYYKLKANNKLIIPVGLSMGGIIAINIASRESVLGVVSMAAPVIIKHKLALASPLLKYIVRFVDKRLMIRKDHEYRICYDKYPLISINELVKLIKETLSLAEKVSAPSLFIQAEDDGTVDIRSIEILYNRVMSSQKEKILLKKGRHIITVEDGREDVFRMVEAFGQRVYNNYKLENIT